MRRGFTAVEILVALMIAATIVAVGVVSVRNRLDAAEAAAIVGSLETVRGAVFAFRKDVGRYPRTLRQFMAPPDADVPGENAVHNDDICEIAIPPAAIAKWRGPYVSRRITNEGLRVGKAEVENLFTRDPEVGVGNIIVTVTDVDQGVAELVDKELDAQVGLGAGVVRHTGTTLTYRIRFSGC